MSVSNAVLECVRILTPTQTDKTLSLDLRQELADILVRLKIWAGNVGVFAPDNASVDHRLRDDPDLVEVVLSMTKKLKQTLLKAIHPPLLEEGDDEGEEMDQGGVADEVSSGSSSASLDLDSSVEESSSGSDLARLGPSATFIEEANSVINRLYRLATVFRKPFSSSENAKIRHFMKKLHEKGDLGELEDVEDHAWCHIKAQFPQAPEFLVSRLVEAAIFRRMKIRYRQRHQDKLSQGIESAFAAPSLYAPYEEFTKIPAAVTLSNLHSGKRDSARGSSGPQPTPRRGPFSATIASSINRARFADYARSTALSGITKAAVGRRQQLDVPPPPKKVGGDKVACPYCLRLVDHEEMRQPRWTRHILKDIDPFVCLFEDCKEGSTLFKTVEDWLGHMRWQHTIAYSCQAVGHERENFGSPQDLEDHIRGEHPGTFTESQLPGIVKQGAVPTPNTIGALNFSLSLNETRCLLCHALDPQRVNAETVDDAAPSSPEQTMQNHILEHLEAIALLALPDSGDADELESDARQPSTDPGAQRIKATDDLPLAIFEDTVAQRAEDESVPDQDGHDDCWAAVFQEVKQSRFLEPHEDHILIELGEGRKNTTNAQVVVEGAAATEETILEGDRSRIDSKHNNQAFSDRGVQKIVLPERLRHTEADSDVEDGKYGDSLQDASHKNLAPDPATIYSDQQLAEPSHKLRSSSSMKNLAPSEGEVGMSEEVCTTQKAPVPELQKVTLSNETTPPKNLGIRIAFEPEDQDNIEFDIVAVPGIGSDPETIWRHIDRDPRDNSKVKEMYWLSDPSMLPNECPNARIMSFGYDSYWVGDAPARQRLGEIAFQVLNDLARFRKDCDRRPLLLICHSYGGIVMQQAYLLSHQFASDYPGIYDAITGFIFLGTPHNGSDIAKIEAEYEIYQVTRQQNLQTKDSLLQTLVPDNTVRVNIVADFTREVKQRTAPPEIFCFYEQLPTNVGLLVGLKDYPKLYVANESSGTLPGYEKRGLPLDHFSINKFSSNQDYNYIAVVHELVKMRDKTKDIMRKREEAFCKPPMPKYIMKSILISPESKADDVHKGSGGVLPAHGQQDLAEDSVRHFTQVLEWCRVNYGTRHPDTARQLYNLALAHEKHGDYLSAEELYLEAIEAMESIYGKDAPSADLLHVKGSLARMYGQQGLFAEADILLRGVVEGQTEILGFDHPETLITRMYIALVAQDMRPGELEAPAKALEDVFATQVHLLGSEHPSTLKTAVNLGQSYRLGGRSYKAHRLFRVSLEKQRHILGDSHPDTVRTAAMLKDLEEYDLR